MIKIKQKGHSLEVYTAFSGPPSFQKDTQGFSLVFNHCNYTTSFLHNEIKNISLYQMTSCHFSSWKQVKSPKYLAGKIAADMRSTTYERRKKKAPTLATLLRVCQVNSTNSSCSCSQQRLTVCTSTNYRGLARSVTNFQMNNLRMRTQLDQLPKLMVMATTNCIHTPSTSTDFDVNSMLSNKLIKKSSAVLQRMRSPLH